MLGEGVAGEAKRRLVERAGGIVTGEDDGDARLAFIAFEDEAQAAGAAERLRRRGLLVNVADRPELCDFTVPAVVDRDPVLVAVGTAGASAGLAKWLRLQLEALLPSDLGRLAEALAAARQTLRRRWPDPQARREALDAALAPGGPLDPLRPQAAEAVPAWLAAADPAGEPLCVEIVLRSGDPEDLTLREARWLGRADTVLYEQGVPDAILARARADAGRGLLGTAEPKGGVTVTLRCGGRAV